MFYKKHLGLSRPNSASAPLAAGLFLIKHIACSPLIGRRTVGPLYSTFFNYILVSYNLYLYFIAIIPVKLTTLKLTIKKRTIEMT